MRTTQPPNVPKSARILDLWLQWQLASWKGLGLLCIPMLCIGILSRWLWPTHSLLNLILALSVGFLLQGVTVGQQQHKLLYRWLGLSIPWRRATTWGTILGSLATGLVCLLGLSLSAALIVTLILMPFGLLFGLFTPILGGCLGGFILGQPQKTTLIPHLQRAYQWPLWSGLGGLIAGIFGSVGGAMINGLLSNILAVARWSDGAAETAITLQGIAFGLLLGWAGFQAVTGWAIAGLLDRDAAHLQ